MVTQLSHELAEVSPSFDYPLLEDFNPSVFCGYVIKNLFDEKRFNINKKYNPQRFSFKTNEKTYRLYGMVNEVPVNNLFVKALINTPPTNIGEYNSLLTLNGLSCFSCFLYFNPGLYPIDTSHTTTFIPDVDLKNFSCEKSLPFYQSIGHIYLFALINLDKK